MHPQKVIVTTFLVLVLVSSANAGIDILGRLGALRGDRCWDIGLFSWIFFDAQRAGLTKAEAYSEVATFVREKKYKTTAADLEANKKWGRRSILDHDDLWERHQSDIDTALNEIYELGWVPEESRLSVAGQQCKRQVQGRLRLTPTEIGSHLSRLPTCQHFQQKEHCQNSLIWLDQKEFARRVPLLCSREESPPPASITISTDDLEWEKEKIEGRIVFSRDHNYVFRGHVDGFKYSGPRLDGFGGLLAAGHIVMCGITELARRLGKCVVYMSEDTERKIRSGGSKNPSTLDDIGFVVGFGDSGMDQAQFNDQRLSKAALYLDARLTEDTTVICDEYRAKR